MAIIAAAASLIVPAIVVTGGIVWSAGVFSGSLAMAFIWALLATMMVGIETAGVATVSRLRANRDGSAGNGSRGVYLATAAKVTCYSSILMVVWVLLGGTQLVVAIHYFDLLDQRIEHWIANASDTPGRILIHCPYRWIILV